MKLEIHDGVLISVQLENRDNKIVIPEGVSSIGKEAFKDCAYLEEVELADSIINIGEHAFDGCESLKHIKMPSALKVIGAYAFDGCVSLTEVNVPDSTECIEEYAFHKCNSLKEVTIPVGVKGDLDSVFCCCIGLEQATILGDVENLLWTFSECENLKKVVLPNSISSIGYGAFERCFKLKEINLPNKIEIIEGNAFLNCDSLEKIRLPENLKIIERNAFQGCSNLKKVAMGSQVTRISDEAFLYCTNLEDICLPDGLRTIGNACFGGCQNLKTINLGNSLISIGASAFSMCQKLENIALPESLKNIYGTAFSYCTKLENINIPPLIEILEGSFVGCSNLEKVSLSDNIRTIGDDTFFDCQSLKEVRIPSKVETIDKGAFQKCKALNKIVLENYSSLFSEGIGDVFSQFEHVYIDKNTNNLIITKKEDILGNEYKKIEYEEIQKMLECGKKAAIIIAIMFDKEELEKRELSKVKYILKELVKEKITKDNFGRVSTFLLNSKEFDRLIKVVQKSNEQLFEESSISRYYTYLYYDIFKLFYSLGGFNDNPIERQKACEFLTNEIKNGNIDVFNRFHQIFESMRFKGYNNEWAKFFMDKKNFETLMDFEKEQEGFIARVYNDFENIKEYCRSNRGSQSYRAVTIEGAMEYFSRINFENVTSETADISETISEYTNSQEAFNCASDIRRVYLEEEKKGKIKSHILGETLSDSFDDVKKEIANATNAVLKNMRNVAHSKFTYEFLSKYDSKNFVLGKYCSCCAHLEGAGYGIMKASILHPDCQNLVIRDDKGNIIAKSTLYINREQGYGVFNNIEINKVIVDPSVKKEIYIKYIKAVSDFAKVYNKKNPSKPLKQINVGMSLNDLEDDIRKNNKKSDCILKAINFSYYGKSGQSYNGDWQNEQYVVWRKKKDKEARK